MNGYLPPDRAASALKLEFRLAEVALAEAWAHVARGVHSLHVDRSAAGATCISALIDTINDPDSLDLWMISPDDGHVSLCCVDARAMQSRQPTMRSALDAVTPVTQEQWRSIEILANAILDCWQPHPAEEAGGELKVAA